MWYKSFYKSRNIYRDFFFILYIESIWECGGDYFSKYFIFINALK
jgi:hypothetical protein